MFDVATEDDAAELAALHAEVAADLTERHGRGHWSHHSKERGVLHGIKTSHVLVARDASGIVGTLRLATKKPWAIDLEYFKAVKRPLHLVDMAVEPRHQRRGIGRRLMKQAEAAARAWPADAIRLDAYDAPAGAGGFYAKCGFRQVGRKAYRGVPLIYFERLL